ncbi:unknown [Helicoverpa armigera nucleopolyhedrovirus]|nr:hypothetical protein HanGV4gp045 [Helicoverpa armigera nucleopolyhedrovirus G4]NP_203601.1 hypothetical protein [Helicoverpa armigera nucleopolyhedrovirus]AAL56191.1 ORF46 [Helicoverpa zea single nucleopolyhedrovirus]AEN03969.1 hypothetical protein [Helicoverpa armigera NPV strain Australia]AMN15470.1 ORF45 [Helicoverpa SNPV AC53]AXR98034.1 hypothetical protein [Helicoverpa assulta nucleopolyhedrovirus]BAG74610.1 hypothetical protein [Helicoverpa armigera NPV NNg1]
MSDSTSGLSNDSDIFDVIRVRVLRYDEYHQLQQYTYSHTSHGQHYYIDRYTNKEQSFPRQLKVLSDYDNYLLLVY